MLSKFKMKSFINLLFLCIVALGINNTVAQMKPGDPGVCPNPSSKSKKTSYICCAGYEYIKKENICKPHCFHGCEGGICKSPGECHCDLPLVLNEDRNKCIESKCEIPCVNGRCLNNTCKCDDGFIRINNTHCGIECEPGFQYDENLDCKPICNPPCSNGVCKDNYNGNVCECNQGYELIEDDTNCKPICDPECHNAECVLPNTCRCYEGYNKTLDNSTCEPKCDKECQNGYCISPNTCECEPGYVQDENDKFKCIPHCNPECINGECKEPNICSCFDNFELSEDKGNCKPICAECYNGTCIGPNNCSCDVGYQFTEGSCIPICNKTCKNGYCSSPDSCTCYDDYTSDGDTDICYKPCEPSCVAGICSQHGICICIDGYIMKNNTCVPETTNNLKTIMPTCKSCNGSCAEENSCSCANGTPCHSAPDFPAEVQSPKLAGLEVTWLVGGAIGVLLLTLVIITIERLWRRKKEQAETDKPQQLGSVMYSVSVPDTLIRTNDFKLGNDNLENDEEVDGKEDGIAMTSIPLLDKNTNNINITES